MDKYALEQHWAAVICPTGTPIVWQPWIKVYSGEVSMMGSANSFYYARIWEAPEERKLTVI